MKAHHIFGAVIVLLCIVGIALVGYVSHDTAVVPARIFLTIVGLAFVYILARTMIELGSSTVAGVYRCSSRSQPAATSQSKSKAAKRTSLTSPQAPMEITPFGQRSKGRTKSRYW